jgi:hypothetical protein
VIGAPVSTASTGRLLVGFAVAVLAVAFAGVCVQAGTAWPWSAVVHENGERTLLQTIGYFDHASRELPLDLLLALVIAGAAARVFPEAPPTARRRMAVLLIAGGLVAAGIIAGAWQAGGAAAVRENLLQMPTRAGAPLVTGAHWRYHLLSSTACMLLALGLAATVGAGVSRRPGLSGRGSLLTVAAWILFAGLTLVFGVNRSPFADAVYLGHQARELATHAIVTVPLGLGLCLRLAATRPLDPRRMLAGLLSPAVLGPALLAIAIGVYLAAGVMMTGAVDQGQTSSLSALIFPHFFEHTLTYLVVGLISPAAYLWATRS